LLRRADGGIESLEHLSGPPLGIKRNAKYTSAAVDLHAGDAVLVVTDGFTEAVDPGGQLFGGSRVEHHLAAANPSQDALAGLVKEVRSFEAGEPPADDMAAILLSWEKA
jgi:phosphoserine phosphatase RsbU/P